MEKQKLLNINDKVTDGTQFKGTRKYFTYEDIIKLKKYLSATYANFNGGFGLYNDEKHVLMSKVEDNITFSFVLEHHNREELARINYRKVLFDDEDVFKWNAYTCVDKMSWLETIIILCEEKGILFRYDPSIIDEIIK